MLSVSEQPVMEDAGLQITDEKFVELLEAVVARVSA